MIFNLSIKRENTLGLRLAIFLTFSFLITSIRCRAQQLEMSLEWICSTTNTADFQIRLTNTDTVPITFNALIIRGIHASNLTMGTITWIALNDNTIPEWLNWPNTGTINLPYISSQSKLNFSSSTGIFTSATAQAIPSGAGIVVGTFRMSTTTTWVPNSNFGFVWEATSGGVVAYVNGASTVTNILQYIGSSGQYCSQCLTVTASSAQPLNLSAPSIQVNQSLCSGSTVSDLSAIPLYISPQIASILWYDNPTGGTALNPTTLLSNGTYYASQLVNGCESATREATIVSITPSTTNTTQISACGTYTWANNGQTYTASGTYSGTTSNCVSETLNLTITQSTTNTTPISACGTYTWANNGQTYTASGTYSGTTSNCVSETLDLTITPSTTNTTPISACGTYTWANNGQTYTASGTYSGTTSNCVSETLNLTITPSTTNTTPISTCETYTWANNGQTYTTSGIYSGTTVNCVTQVINLTITPNSESTISVSACGVYAWYGQTYTTSGIYSNTNSNCFTEILDLTITPSSTNTTTIVSPSSFTWGNTGITYTSSGFYMGSTVNCVTQYLDLTINSSGISEEEMVLFSLYPNPVSEALTIDFNGVSNEEYLIVDNFGSVVKIGVLENMSTEISVSELSAGLYYFKIEGTKPRKFSKIN
jgi:hypothetical protein